jgi:hypothetical protein
MRKFPWRLLLTGNSGLETEFRFPKIVDLMEKL